MPMTQLMMTQAARGAPLLVQIRNGAKSAEWPVEQAMTCEFVINLKAAEALGLTIPPARLFQAIEVLR
jgi:putative ABC transport system substrate-binding protein